MARELNLLPPERRKKLARQSILSAVNSILDTAIAGLTIVTISGVVALIGLQGFSFATSRSSDVNLDALVREYNETRKFIVEQNSLLETMHMLSEERVVWSTLMRDMFAILPSGTTIRVMDGRVQDGMGRFSFEGKAITRNTLIVLKDRLQQLGWVQEVKAPHSNLVDRVNPQYKFTVIMEENPNNVTSSEEEE